MKPSQIAAAIPTHNRPDDLADAIASVRRQSLETEIIVVDDGSAPPLDRRDLPECVRLVRHDDAKGPAGARNAAVDVSAADWVAFLDDDDRWLPGKVAALSDAIEGFDDAVVVFHRTGYRPENGRKRARRIDDPLKRLIRSQPPHLSGVAVRKDLHQAVRFDESMWATQDLDYLIRLAKKGGIWVEIPRVLSVHSPRLEQDSAITLESRIEGRLSLLDRHGELIRGDRRAHAFYFARLAHQYRRSGRLGEARNCFMRSLTLDPTCWTAWMGLIRLYVPIPTRKSRPRPRNHTPSAG